MGKKSDVPLEKVHVALVVGDWETLDRFYGRTIKVSGAIRALVNRHCKALLERELETNVQRTDLPEPDLDSLGLGDAAGGD